MSWQRKANYYAVKWGTLAHSEEKVQRAEFKGELRPSQVAPGLELYFNPTKRLYRQVISYCTTFFLCGLVVVMVLAISIYKAVLIQAGNHQLGVTVCALINTVQIIGMNIVYDKLALKLNEWENYQTISEYENALVVKKVGYQFVNYYISLFYIAFAKEHFEGCVQGDCMGELRSSLWVYYLINVIFNFIELGVPLVSQKRAIAAELAKTQGKSTRTQMTYTEAQGKLSHITFLDEYLEVVMNHGYIVFFCVAFPLGPLIYWVYNLAELKADGYKFLYLCKRPFPERAGGIGVWNDVMNALAVVGVICNIGLMVFTKNLFGLSIAARWGVFIVLEHIILLVVALYLCFAPRLTESKVYAAVRTALSRHKYLLKLKYYCAMSEDGSHDYQGTTPPRNSQVHSDE